MLPAPACGPAIVRNAEALPSLNADTSRRPALPPSGSVNLRGRRLVVCRAAGSSTSSRIPQAGVDAPFHVILCLVGGEAGDRLAQCVDRSLAEGLLHDLRQRLEDLRRVKPTRADMLALLERDVLGFLIVLALLRLLGHLLLAHLGPRLNVRHVLVKVLLEGLCGLLVGEHLLEQRPNGIARIPPRHRLGEVYDIREQQVLPRRLLHLTILALCCQVDAVKQVEARRMLTEQLRVLQHKLLTLLVVLIDGGILEQDLLVVRHELLVAVREARLVCGRHLELSVLCLLWCRGCGRRTLLVLRVELILAHVADVQLLRRLHPFEFLLCLGGRLGLELFTLLCLFFLALLPLLALQADHQVVVNVGVEIVLIIAQLDVVPFAVVDRHGGTQCRVDACLPERAPFRPV
mmetsp:Transcript_16496/g.42330  ORF Transcript_16496/g.42330 Transcript_16496/m.42330 type:complete len:404 (-) Transcript_16496:47-1258(-)